MCIVYFYFKFPESLFPFETLSNTRSFCCFFIFSDWSRFLHNRHFTNWLGSLCYFWLVVNFSHRRVCFNNLLFGLLMDGLKLWNFHDWSGFSYRNWFRASYLCRWLAFNLNLFWLWFFDLFLRRLQRRLNSFHFCKPGFTGFTSRSSSCRRSCWTFRSDVVALRLIFYLEWNKWHPISLVLKHLLKTSCDWLEVWPHLTQ